MHLMRLLSCCLRGFLSYFLTAGQIAFRDETKGHPFLRIECPFLRERYVFVVFSW